MNKLLKKRISRIKYLAFALIVLISIFLLSIIIFEKNEYNNRLNYLESEVIHNFEEEYEIVLYSYRQLSNSYYANIINNSRILEIMHEANNSNTEDQAKLRNELITLVQGDYDNALLADFRQYHFVLNNNESFLRMHKKEKFGDDLSDVRYTVKYVNETGNYIEGFEEGRIFNGYRFEYPLYFEEELVGCVEISMSFESISNMMKKLFNTNTIFLMKKEIVDAKVWEEEIALNYSIVEFSDNYYVDNKTINDLTTESLMNISDKGEITRILENDQTYNIHSKIGDLDYCNGFILIRNVEDIPAAYLVFTSRCDTIYDLNQAYISKILLFTFLWVLLIIIIIIIVQNRIKIEKITSHDELTEAYNRNLLYKNLQEEIAYYNKKKIPFSVILVDVDDFKQINDKLGHLSGDRVLRNIVEIFDNILTKKGYIFRYGGDEFLIILNSTNKEESIKIAEELKKEVNTRIILEDKPVGLSMGLVFYEDSIKTPEVLINRADKCLYKSKELGKNQVYYKC
ncbi:MAG: diguanylate cyclase [Pleomorphochaeta sp.]